MAVLFAITVSSTLAECPGGRVLIPHALTLDLTMELVLASGPYGAFEQKPFTAVVWLGFASCESLPSVVKTTHPREWWLLYPWCARSRHKEANKEQPKPVRLAAPSSTRGPLSPPAALVVHREDRDSVVSPGIGVICGWCPS